MALAATYPALYQEWVAAGGIENNFRSHLLALGILPATRADLLDQVKELRSKVDQVEGLAAKLPFRY
jgi:uncharacterized protein Yka (UPF0111/DUF47 family)